MITFNDLGLSEKVLKAITELGFKEPMPIQEKAIPHILEGKGDLVGLAQTGTGKTAAFGLPLIENIDTKKNITQVLVICPTRELCLQITDDLLEFSKYIPELKVLPVFGGASIEKQIKSIKKGIHIIVATPGRMVDLINRQKVDLHKVKAVVLDEADEMLNMGFRDDLNTILEQTPDKRDTYLFSATMPKEVAAIAKNYMVKPTEIKIGKKNAGSENVHHICYMVHAKDRYEALKRIADYNPNIYGIIFCRTRKDTQEVADKLIKDGYNADSLHGDLSQAQREHVMSKFRMKNLQMLVATDVAARGLDVDNLSHVINYNIPEESEVYTHRSGRTGRAGKNGISVVIAHSREKRKIHEIEKIINKKFEFLPVPLGKDICEKQLFHLIDRMERVEIDHSQIDNFLPVIYKKLEWLSKEDLIKHFVSLEFNIFLEYYKNTPDLNIPDLTRERKDRRDSRDSGKPFNRSNSGYTRFFINLGKKDRIKPQDLIGIVNDATGVRNISIGEIDIYDKYSFFEADSNFEAKILSSFNDFEFKKRKVAVEVSQKKKSGGRPPKGRFGSGRFGGGSKPKQSNRKRNR